MTAPAEWPEIIEAGAAVTALIGGGLAWNLAQLAAVKKDLTAQIEERAEMFKEHDEKDAAAFDQVHKRINEVKDLYVRRDDLSQHVGRFEATLGAMQTRLDTLFTLIQSIPGVRHPQ